MLLLQLDPQTPAEVLPLVLGFGSDLDTFLCSATHADPTLEPMAKVLESAHEAILRGLVFRMGMQSSILHAYTVDGWSDRPQEGREAIEEQARPLLAKKLPTPEECLAIVGGR